MKSLERISLILSWIISIVFLFTWPIVGLILTIVSVFLAVIIYWRYRIRKRKMRSGGLFHMGHEEMQMEAKEMQMDLLLKDITEEESAEEEQEMAEEHEETYPSPKESQKEETLKEYETVQVLFATDREKAENSRDVPYYGPDRNKENQLEYGVSKVSIPKNHK